MNTRIACCITVMGILAGCAGGNDPLVEDPGNWENSLGMKFVRVPATGVRFCIVETRVRDYQSYVTATGRKWNKPPPFVRQEAGFPAVNVDWASACDFCEWLTVKEKAEGRLGERQRYRLPTDAEWSRAVGIGEERGATAAQRHASLKVWPWGGIWPPPKGAGNYFDLACLKWHRAWSPDWGWYIIESYDDGFPHLAPVGSFPPNSIGLHDLGGNVWEWCADRAGEGRIRRGAGWYDSHPITLLSSTRDSNNGQGSWDTGFRIVLSDGADVEELAGAAQEPEAVNKAALATTRPSASHPMRDMVLIDGGEFDMGDTYGDGTGAWAAEVPVHKVRVSPFHLARYEVTVGQFRAFVEATGFRTDAEREGASSAWVTWDSDTKSTFAPVVRNIDWRNPGFAQSDADPVVCISWNDATAYCNWLSGRESLPAPYDLKTGALLDRTGGPTTHVRAVEGYRLPTEAEWEFAARERGRKVRFGNGRDVARSEEINFFASQGEFTYAEKGRYRKSTTPVASFAPNALGLYDMSGNAWEWCSDFYSEYTAQEARDPCVCSGGYRILRGGRWGAGAKGIRATARHFEGPALRCNNSGFRIARTAQ